MTNLRIGWFKISTVKLKLFLYFCKCILNPARYVFDFKLNNKKNTNDRKKCLKIKSYTNSVHYIDFQKRQRSWNFLVK